MLEDFPEKLARANRVEQMAWVAKQHPLPEQPARSLFDWPGDPRWYIDQRHRDWLQGVLMSGRFRRVLEIGCFHGYSTVAFLEALKAGAVDEVHLCDTTITEQLERVLTHYNLPGVVVHHCRSVELLARESFDFVFVDGDHGAETCKEEARLLIAAQARVVMAHDTSVAPLFPLCDGPQHLKQAFQAAGYGCLEDAVLREGEHTERGMFFAAAVREDYEIGLEQFRFIAP